MQTISPTDPGYFTQHDTAALHSIVTRYTADSLAMAESAPGLAQEALSLANAAWAELVIRGEA